MCWLTKAWPSTTSVTVFFRCAHCKNRATDRQGGDGSRSIAARAPQDYGTESSLASYGIVDAARDGSFANQKRIGHPRQALEGVSLGVGNRLARAVGAGHDEDFRRAGGEKQMVQGRVWQHHAELVVIGRNTGQLQLRRSKHDGAGNRGQQRLDLRRYVNDHSRRVGVFNHYGKRLFLAVLALAQRIYGNCVLRVAGQVIPAQAFHGDDLSFAQQLDRLIHGRVITADDLGSVMQNVMRTAMRAGDRLRVKAPIGRIVILPRAVRVERPVLHCGIRAVVGQSEDYSVARPAIGAVDVRIVKAGIGGIEQFLQARGADRQVGRDANCRPIAAFAFANREVGKTQGLGVRDMHFCDGRSRRGFGSQLLGKRK